MRLLNPLERLSTAGRTEMAVKLYEKEVFPGATFADMEREGDYQRFVASLGAERAARR